VPLARLAEILTAKALTDREETTGVPYEALIPSPARLWLH
jgi:hypothetical protein